MNKLMWVTRTCLIFTSDDKSEDETVDEPECDIINEKINAGNKEMPNLTSDDESEDETVDEPMVETITLPHLDNYIKTETNNDSDEINTIKNNRRTKSERRKNSGFIVNSVIKLSKVIKTSRMSVKMFKSRCKNPIKGRNYASFLHKTHLSL